MRPTPLLCAFALVLVGCQQNPYTFRYSDPAGTVVNYKFELTAKSDPSGVKDPKTWPKRLLEPSSMDVSGTMTIKVDAADDKRITVKSWSKPGTAVGTGFGKGDAADYIAKGIEYQEYDVDQQRKFLRQDSVQDPMTNTLNGLFPKEPVRVGDKWEYKPFPQDVPAKATFQKMEAVAGVDAAKIYIDVPSGTSGKTHMIAWIDPKNGRLVKAEIVSVVDQDGMKFHSTFTQTMDASVEPVSDEEYKKQEAEFKRKEEEEQKKRAAAAPKPGDKPKETAGR
ncbi:MAG: hypothetical protein AB7F50_06925 [Fimbriimonadaceae bacterium]